MRIAAWIDGCRSRRARLAGRFRSSPGHLFVVGDPKQSIYRFRRADISLYLAAARRFGPDGGGVVELSANFRTVEPVIVWVNTTFAALMAPESEADAQVASQPPYVPLEAVRPAPPVGPPISLLGREELPAKWNAAEVRTTEAAGVADTITRIIDEGWSVDARDGPGGAGRWRPARLGDITVLVPARTSLPFLEDALEEANIAYRAESSSLVYSTRAVRDLLMVLRAADDPTNHLHVVSALRTALLGCGDDDLFRFKVEHGGRWSYLADQPDSLPEDDPVLTGLVFLRSLHNSRHWLAPSELLGRIAMERRAFELGFGEGRPRDVWRRLRYVTDQARSWSESTGGSLRQYLQWVEHQTTEGARVAEAVLPETDDDSVRIMTVHAAKGLEFPITIVSGMSTLPQSRPVPAEVAFPPGGSVGYRFGSKVHHRGVLGLEADRRADGLPRTDPTALRRVHEGMRSPRRVPAPLRAAHACRRRSGPAPSCSMKAWGNWWMSFLTRSTGSGRTCRRTCRASVGPTAVRDVGRRAHCRPGRTIASLDRGGHCTDARGHARRRRGDRGRTAQTSSGPGSSAVAEGSLRHCRGPGRARCAADDRPVHGRRARRRGRRTMRGGGHPESPPRRAQPV